MTYETGQLIRIGWYSYCHYAIVSDRHCDGKPMLISLSRRTGTVVEEPWDVAVQGKRVRPSRIRSKLGSEQIIQRARSQEGCRRYRLFRDNCEHFARESLGLTPRSRQLHGAAGTGIAVMLLVLRFARVHPVVGVAATVASIALGSRFSAR